MRGRMDLHDVARSNSGARRCAVIIPKLALRGPISRTDVARSEIPELTLLGVNESLADARTNWCVESCAVNGLCGLTPSRDLLLTTSCRTLLGRSVRPTMRGQRFGGRLMSDPNRSASPRRIPTPEPEPRHPREDGLRRGYKWSTNLPSSVMSNVLAAKKLRGRNVVSDDARSNVALDDARSNIQN